MNRGRSWPLKKDLRKFQQGKQAVGPDRTIFDSSGQQIFTQKYLKYLVSFLSCFEKKNFRVNTAMATFWATFGITLATFVIISGHTGCSKAGCEF